MNNNYNIDQGDKILKSFSFFNDKEKKLEKAMDYYKKALVEFIENKDFVSHSILAEKIGDEYLKINDKNVALANYKNAQKFFENHDVDKYVSITINKIIPLYIENEQLRDIGKNYHQLAKLTIDDDDNEQTMNYFDKAVAYLETEKSHDLLNCYKDFTYYLLDQKNIDTAIHYITLIIKFMADNLILVYQATEYVFLFLLCILTKGDCVLVRKKIEEYSDLINVFINSPKHKLIEALNETCENNDIDKFIDVVEKYDDMYKLKPHEIKLLLLIKKNIQSNCNVDLS
jgi:tetratricopeptide (TPR) repeat protein